MNTDIRVAVGMTTHPKTIKLMRRCGDRAFFCLISLWSWAALNRPDGDFSGMDREDIEIVAGWNGDFGFFADQLCEIGFMDCEDGNFSLHDWIVHNPWAAGSEDRSDAGRLNRMKMTMPDEYGRLAEAGATGISKADYEAIRRSRKKATTRPPRSTLKAPLEATSSEPLTPAPAPAPAPAPNTKEKDSCPEPSAKASEPQQAEQKAKPGNHDQPEPAILTFPLAKKGETFPVTQSEIGEWGESFPGIDLFQELRHCLQWNRDNPTRRKTRAGIRRHITSWLAKAQDRARGQPGPSQPAGGYPAPRTVKDAITIQQDMESKRLLEKKLRERGIVNGNGIAGNGAGCTDDAQHQVGQGPNKRQHLIACS